MLVLALGALFGQIPFGPLRFGAAGALFIGLLLGALDPRLGAGLTTVKQLGVVLFCYTVGLSAGSTFLSDLRRQWNLILSGIFALGITALIASSLCRITGISPAGAAGIFTGVLTSPAIDAATTATNNDPHTLVGYALAYPTGVIVGMAMVAMVAKRRWPARRDNISLAEAGLTATTVVVDNRTELTAIPGWASEDIKISYLRRGDTMRVLRAGDHLDINDEVLIVGNPDDVANAIAALGHPSPRRLTDQRREVDFRRFLVSNPDLAGRSIADLNIAGRLNGIVTRVRRNDLDMLARDAFILQLGDRILAVVPAERMGEASEFFGDSDRRVHHIDAVTLGLGAAMGLAAGSVTIPLPGGINLCLGAAAGSLIVGMILGALHRTGPLRWDLPHAVNATLRQLGLMIFLSCIGLATGTPMIQHAFTTTGIVTVVISGITLVSGGVVLLVIARIIDLSAQRATGAFAGFVGQPAILSYANSLINDERIDSAYGALFAAGTIAKILLVQLILKI
ncbi:MAG: aspartate:alanine exchanger family transporter [Propionibacteriaceae bacterium]